MQRFFNEYKNIISFDIETSDGNGHGSLDPKTGFIALMQLSINNSEPELLRPTKENLAKIRQLSEDDDNLFIIHNAAFEIPWMLNNGVSIKNIFDTMVASQVLYAGLKSLDEATRKIYSYKKAQQSEEDEPLFDDVANLFSFHETKSSKRSYSLQTCLLRELNVFIPKDAQNSDWAGELTKEQIEYAKNDVKYLYKLANTLWGKIQQAKLERTIMLEMELLKPIALMRWYGVGIDKEKWRNRTEELKKELLQLKDVLELKFGNEFYKTSNNQQNTELFEGAVEYRVNLNSSVQMPKVLGLPNIQSNTLLDNVHKNPLIVDYLEYKTLEKDVSTYGSGYLSKITENRLYGDFKQAETATGRISSAKPNLQNIPPFFKEMVRPINDNFVPVIMDFSQVELRIMAYQSNDEAFIEALESSDMHSINARRMFHIPDNEPVPPELRKKAKSYAFGIAYGLSPSGAVARKLSDNFEDAQKTIESFYKAYPKVAEFLKQNYDHAKNHGYITDYIGRRRLFELPKEPKNYNEKLKLAKSLKINLRDRGFDVKKLIDMGSWDEIKKLPELEVELISAGVDEFGYKVMREVYKYESTLASIGRQGQNMPIQSASADITKRALVDLFNYFVETGYGFLTLTVHDSILMELDKRYFKTSFPKVKEIMESAGKKIIPNIHTPVEADIGWLEHYKCSTCGDDIKKYNMYYDENTEYGFSFVDPNSVVCDKCKKGS